MERLLVCYINNFVYLNRTAEMGDTIHNSRIIFVNKKTLGEKNRNIVNQCLQKKIGSYVWCPHFLPKIRTAKPVPHS